MTAYNAKHPYEPDWQIPRGVWAKYCKTDDSFHSLRNINIGIT